jgi:guanylate kinase
MSEATVPHLNLSSYPGGGKTTILKILLSQYRAILIPKITTRPKRLNENGCTEYIYVSEDEFSQRESAGHFLGIEPILVGGEVYHHAIPKIEHWPAVPDKTNLILSVFGIKAELVKELVLNYKLCFIGFKNKDILKKRLFARCLVDGGNFEEKWVIVEQYMSQSIENNYDYIVYNDGTPEECIAQIRKIL